MTLPASGPLPETPLRDGRRWHYRRSLASRVILLTTMAVGLAVAFVALAAYVTARMQLQSTMDSSLMDRAVQTAQAPTVLNMSTDQEIPVWALVATDVRIAMVYSDGRIFLPESRDGAPKMGKSELAVARGEESSSIRTVRTDGVRYRVVAVRSSENQAVVLAQSLEPQTQVLAKLGIVMLLFGLSGVIVAGMAGWAVARNGLRPVRRLTGAVEHIARTEDLTPLPVEGADEIARLATAFNQMLAALSASRDRQRQLVADAGHELRTPLTSLRTNIDLLTQADAAGGLPADARAELLADVQAQLEELTNLIGDLVELARDEPLAHVVETVDLSEVLDHTLVRVRRRAQGITFEIDADPWYVVGETGALERALTNLLDNAAKWSPEGGTVRVHLHDGTLVVDDEGPGIAEHDLPHIFDRFYRSDESRTMPGSGLGLSIVHQVAARHAGSVTAGRSPYGGAQLRLSLPGSSQARPTGPPPILHSSPIA